MRLFVPLIALVLAGCRQSDANKPIEVGHVYASDHGDASFKALELAIEEMNKDPAKLPLGRPVIIRHASAGTKPEDAGAQATRLLALNKVRCLIGGENTEQSKRIGDALSGDAAIGITLADWPGTSPSQNLFAVGIAPTERGRVLAKIALEQKPTAVVILRDQSAVSANLAADRFAADCTAAGVRVIDQDFTNAGPKGDVVFFACAASRALEARRPNMKLCLFGGGDAELPGLVAGSASADGFVVATSFYPEVGVAFVNRYREKYGQSPSTAAALAYDAFNLWVEAVRRANSIDAGPLCEHLLSRSTPFDATTGPLTFADDHTARRRVFVGRLVDSKLGDIKAFDPEPTKQP